VQVLKKITSQDALLYGLSGSPASIFSVQAVSWSLEMLGTTHPTTQHHTPEDQNLQQHCCENLKSAQSNFIIHIKHFRRYTRVRGWIDIGSVALRTESKPSVWTTMCLETTNVLILDYICVRDRGCGTRQPNWTSDIRSFCTLHYS
jgi:hypothetical protein